MAGLNDGIENEIQITSEINNKRLKVLSTYQKKFIEQIIPDASEDSVIHAEKIGGQGFKPDIQIEIENRRCNVSVKKGSGNSVHQEKTEYFLHYCIQYLDMTDNEKQSLLFYLYGDGTVDGDSLPEERLSDEELLKTYAVEIQCVQKFLDRNKRNLIERFLIYGRLGKQRNIRADYLYHGDSNEGVWCPLDDDTVDYLATVPNSKEAPLSIGSLTLQVWNRNLNATPKMEDRRHSIQIKWGACKTHIDIINKRHLEKPKVEKVKFDRVVGDNSQGFENQERLIQLIDYQRVGSLIPSMKALVKEIYPHAANSDIVKAIKLNGTDIKPRIAISINDEVKNLSVFMGTGNAVHQEGIQTFIPFCKDELGMTDVEEKALLELIYGDGTIDGISSPEKRLNDAQIKVQYINQINLVQQFLNKNRRAFIERFLIYGKGGKNKNIKSDFIYYGTDTTGRINSYPEVVEYLVNQKNSSSALLSIGSLTIQTWNRNLSAIPKFEHKRNSIQVKWGSMKKNLNNIRENLDKNTNGTTDGDWEEYELVSRLNRNKNISNKLWSKIASKLGISDINDVYAVRVCNTVYSSLAERNVLPKADIYLVKGNISQEVLLDNNYWLDEDTINGLDIKVINDSGISCKRPNSNSFTYAKFSVNSFVSLFGNRELGAGISIFVKEDELYLNSEITVAWGTCEQNILNKYNLIFEELNIFPNDRNLRNLEVCKIIKNSSIEEAQNLIKNNVYIGDAIFKGKGIFVEPYVANFTYINGEVEIAYTPKFSITTGSGRHKGSYTIVIKP